MSASSNTIFTLESRENYYLEVTKAKFKLSDEEMYRVIQQSFTDFVINLKSKKEINYKDLRNTITPNINRKELALVFDCAKLKSSWYALPIFNELLALFDTKTKHSILTGDFLAGFDYNNPLNYQFINDLTLKDREEYNRSGEYYIIYINNLSKSLFKKLIDKLKAFAPFLGHFDTTYQTIIKSYLSSILCKTCILFKDRVILPNEEDNWEPDMNIMGYPFEKYGFKICSVPSLYFDLFLSYKIEREVFDGYEMDTEISINAISSVVKNIENFRILINQKKLDYLLNEKSGKLKKAELLHYDKSEIEQLIKNKLVQNYIYDLTELKEYDVIKFSVVIELEVSYSQDKVRCNVVLKYNYREEVLELITLF
ncbi:MAG: hypothetical protein KDC67_15975 [Ignavibacteriae bacterium]|nr:hypothetical protein [Ignavibacteriota bacterium]